MILARLKQLLRPEPGPVHLRTGKLGEAAAKKQLKKQGLKYLTANYKTNRGEIDLVFKDKDCLVFVEVKTRRGDRFGAPAEAVGRAKVQRVRRLAAAWLAQSGIHPAEVRFDVVEVRPRRSGASDVTHLPGAF